jgi:hypothetical protein
MEVASAGGGWPIGLVAQPPPNLRNSFFFPIQIRKGDPNLSGIDYVDHNGATSVSGYS